MPAALTYQSEKLPCRLIIIPDVHIKASDAAGVRLCRGNKKQIHNAAYRGGQHTANYRGVFRKETFVFCFHIITLLCFLVADEWSYMNILTYCRGKLQPF